MRPDGGILSVVAGDGKAHPILITEVKNQGTNDLRQTEGKAKQSKGNAIERLGKNVIGFRTALMAEAIVPIPLLRLWLRLRRRQFHSGPVTTIAMFGPLNEINVVNRGEGGAFNRGSFFFREAEWSEAEMEDVMYEIANRAIHYYFAKLGETAFPREQAP